MDGLYVHACVCVSNKRNILLPAAAGHTEMDAAAAAATYGQKGEKRKARIVQPIPSFSFFFFSSGWTFTHSLLLHQENRSRQTFGISKRPRFKLDIAGVSQPWRLIYHRLAGVVALKANSVSWKEKKEEREVGREWRGAIEGWKDMRVPILNATL